MSAGIRRQRRSSDGSRALLTRSACSGQTVRAFCQHESVGPASFYRWRSRLGPAADAGHVPVISVLPRAPTGFVDLGTCSLIAMVGKLTPTWSVMGAR